MRMKGGSNSVRCRKQEVAGKVQIGTAQENLGLSREKTVL